MDHIPYRILAQNLTEELDPTGRFVDVWTVTYQGPSGTSAYVKIPAASYSPAAIDAAIQNDLANIEAVHSLGAEPYQEPTGGA